jgi:hypothetical protein
VTVLSLLSIAKALNLTLSGLLAPLDTA